MTGEPVKRKILSIDGGGIKGTAPAAFLAELEKSLDRPIGAYFDLIAGTSTGGIIAIGLALGLPASQILDFYEKRGPEIFPAGGWLQRAKATIRHAFGPKHDEQRLETVLRSVLGDRKIGEAQTRLLVPAWNPERREVYIYKTAHHERLRTDYRKTALEAAMATTAAPTYFRQHVTSDGVGLVDGGIWANNPVGLAAVEAVTLLGWPGDSLHILSLGCVEEVYDLAPGAGTARIVVDLARLFSSGQSHGALGTAKLISGHEHNREALYRISHTAPKNVFGLDDASKIQRLKGIGIACARDRGPVLHKVFFAQPAPAFVPVFRQLYT